MSVKAILLINTSSDCYAPSGSMSRDRGSNIEGKMTTDHDVVDVERSERTSFFENPGTEAKTGVECPGQHH